MKTKVVSAASAVLVSCGVGVSGIGPVSSTAQAEPIAAPLYHWCPGDFWDPGWGFNWEWSDCHDDWHRDTDGDWHDRDWHPDPDDHDWDRDHGGQWQRWWPR
jgi:hypothetical protein